MSFLSILLVASTFYFAHARPDSHSGSHAFAIDPAYYEYGDEQDARAGPAQSSVPIIDPKDHQYQLFGFMQDVSKAVDQYMTPLITKLDVTKQDELKSMGMNGFASFVNHLLFLIQKEGNEKDKGDDQTHGDSLPRDEMIKQYKSHYPLDPNTPLMADTQYGVEAE